MNTPTIEEVKHHFKNVSLLRCINTERRYVFNDVNILYYSDSYWFDEPKGRAEIWRKGKGYAKIITYKN